MLFYRKSIMLVSISFAAMIALSFTATPFAVTSAACTLPRQPTTEVDAAYYRVVNKETHLFFNGKDMGAIIAPLSPLPQVFISEGNVAFYRYKKESGPIPSIVLVYNGNELGKASDVQLSGKHIVYVKDANDGPHIIYDGKDLGKGKGPKIAGDHIAYLRPLTRKTSYTLVYDGKDLGVIRTQEGFAISARGQIAYQGFRPTFVGERLLYFSSDGRSKEWGSKKLRIIFDGKDMGLIDPDDVTFGQENVRWTNFVGGVTHLFVNGEDVGPLEKDGTFLLDKDLSIQKGIIGDVFFQGKNIGEGAMISPQRAGDHIGFIKPVSQGSGMHLIVDCKDFGEVASLFFIVRERRSLSRDIPTAPSSNATLTITPNVFIGADSEKNLTIRLTNIPADTPLKQVRNNKEVEVWIWSGEGERINPLQGSSVLYKGVLREVQGQPLVYETILSNLNMFPQGKSVVEAFDSRMYTIATADLEVKRPETGCQRFLYNGAPAQKYDLGFIFPNSEKNRARAIVNRYVEDGLKTIEPIRTEIDKFNIWYRVLTPEETKQYDPAMQKLLNGKEEVDLDNPWLKNLCGQTETTILFSPWKKAVSFHRPSTTMITFYQHGDGRVGELSTFLHELGHAFGLGDEYVKANVSGQRSLSSSLPNCSGAVESALWKDMVPGAKGSTLVESLATQIGYYTGDAFNCFKDNTPVSDCYFVGRVADLVFKAISSRPACTFDVGNSQKGKQPLQSGCMFKENGKEWCRNKGKMVLCQKLVAPARVEGGCGLSVKNFSPNIFTIMRWQNTYDTPLFKPYFSRSYGPVVERQICRKLQEVTGTPKGSMGAVCKKYE